MGESNDRTSKRTIPASNGRAASLVRAVERLLAAPQAGRAGAAAPAERRNSFGVFARCVVLLVIIHPTSLPSSFD